MKILPAAAVSAIFLVQTGIASDRVYLCNGVYRNTPCAKGAVSEEHRLPPLTRYKARDYYIPPVLPEDSGPAETKASIDPIRLNSSHEEVKPADTASSSGSLKISGPEVDRFLAKQ